MSKLDYICSEANRINEGKEPSPAPYEPDYTGTITYQAYANGHWYEEVNKCDNTPEGYAGDSVNFISGARAYSQYGEIMTEAHELGGDWLAPVSSKDYKTNDTMDGNTYAGIYGKPMDAFRFTTTRGYIDARVLTKSGWLPKVRFFNTFSDEIYVGNFGEPILGLQME